MLKDNSSLKIAFKEWAAIVFALAAGEQKIILRKGGIAEENGTFRPEHDRFWLYPTYFHEQQQNGLKPTAQKWIALAEQHRHAHSPESNRQVILQSQAVVESVQFLDQWSDIAELDSQHFWTEETVKKRYQYRNLGLYVYRVRVETVEKPVVITETAEYLGCKTWVML